MDLKTTYIPCSPINTPNLPPSTDSVPLADASLIPMNVVQTALCFDGALDEERLKNAVQLLSGVWPTLAGRYEMSKVGEEYEFATQTLTLAQPFPTTHVVQPSPGVFLPPLGENYHLPNHPDAHIFAIRLTTLLPSGNSFLGLQASHLIDGEVKRQLLKILDAFYTHGEAAREKMYELAGCVLPTFFPHVGLLLPYDPIWNLLVERKGHRHDLSGIVSDVIAAAAQSVPVIIELHRSELAFLREKYQQDIAVKLSEQDALSAWWITLLKKVGVDVHRVMYALPQLLPIPPLFPPILPSLAMHAVMPFHIPIPSSSSLCSTPATPAEVAKTIREGLARLRASPDETLRWISAGAYQMRQAAIEGKGYDLLPNDGEVSINSNLRVDMENIMDWQVSFGFSAHQVAFHTFISLPNFLRVFRANSREGEEKGERVELSFNVADEGVKKSLTEIVKEERRAWGKVGAGLGGFER
ncbi:hypothetical protein L202_06700 [Cryptococcus amylolentus CBS 6039]|uniref:Uncharacterized protein n=1 Tax=Cryptococcus amylolentus CBS 6039 TaxID=1295533 RepID=A0A1E3HGV2_9TREE|nr:hypothetical protein L202_06700 [Cryptococcus amylolentus CBS 6039]ODN75573.1 hypothetical protein L202_06700 [Cryptococcus amylolentus CBS 6039]